MESGNFYKDRNDQLCCIISYRKEVFEDLKAEMRDSIASSEDIEVVLEGILQDLATFGIEFEEEEDLVAEDNSNYLREVL